LNFFSILREFLALIKFNFITLPISRQFYLLLFKAGQQIDAMGVKLVSAQDTFDDGADLEHEELQERIRNTESKLNDREQRLISI
jgi:hypothetical protein